MQVKPTPLADWLQFSHSSVRSAPIAALLQRVKKWEPEVYSTLERQLASRPLSSILQDSTVPANPALLCMMDAVNLARTAGEGYLPLHATPVAACSDGPALVSSAAASHPISSEQQEQPGALSEAPQIGEITWLFDGGSPYLAEVFAGSSVPESRLPHFDRNSVKPGRRVVRVLGETVKFVKTIPSNQHTMPFTTMCASALQVP